MWKLWAVFFLLKVMYRHFLISTVPISAIFDYFHYYLLNEPHISLPSTFYIPQSREKLNFLPKDHSIQTSIFKIATKKDVRLFCSQLYGTVKNTNPVLTIPEWNFQFWFSVYHILLYCKVLAQWDILRTNCISYNETNNID